jgi:hypothetical protein
MNAPFKRAIVTLVTGTLLVSCAVQPPVGTVMTDAERSKAKRDCITHYTAVGAFSGAFLGILTGSKKNRGSAVALGAVAGGAIGAALAWGHCINLYSDLTSYPLANAQDTAKKVGYKPALGNLVKIENFRVDPASIAPGKEVKLAGSYYIMAPEGTKEVKVTETRTVSYYDESEKEWKELGTVDAKVTSALGTRRAEGRFELPSDVPEGRYRIALKISALDKIDEVSQEIMVKKG